MNIYDVAYGGTYHDFFWNINVNPNARVSDCLADCTTAVFGLCKIDGYTPVKTITSANKWHLNLADDMVDKSFNILDVEVGDIIEWVKGCHVARVYKIENSKVYVRASWYTGEHGVSVYDHKYDTRPWKTLKEVSDFMVSHYPYRFFHECTLDDEIAGIGLNPEHILHRISTIIPVDENPEVDQIHVLTDVQNVRNNNNQIVGKAPKGFYNVLQTKTNNISPYKWYEVYPDMYIAGVDGRVEFIEGMNETKQLKKEVARLTKLVNDYEERFKQINSLSEV